MQPLPHGKHAKGQAETGAAYLRLRLGLDVETLIDGGEHLVETGEDNDFDETVGPIYRDRGILDVLGNILPRESMR